jgi:hypothetical protein
VIAVSFTAPAHRAAHAACVQVAKVASMKERKTEKLPRRSGYAEPHPQTNKRHTETPDAKTPHEPQNVPERKPLPSNG